MSRACAALAILAILVVGVYGADPKRPTPKVEFYRPSVESLRKSGPLKKLEKAPGPNAEGVWELNAVEADMVIPDPDQPDGERHVRLYSYNEQPCGPTIVSRSGDLLRIKLTNNLPPKPADEPSVPGVNDYHGFNVTNLHTHGLNVTPCDPGDNVFRELRQGYAHTFRYRIPRDHIPGTYFYHPHKHGSVGYQVSCGMVGALVLKDETRGLDSIPAIRGASDHVLVFEQLDMYRNPKGGETWTLTPTQFYYPPDQNGNRLVVTAINGQIAPLIKLKRNEVVRWRLVHGGIEEVIGVTFIQDPAETTKKKTPQMYEIARDGIPLGTMSPPTCPGGDGQPPVTNCFEFYPGNRVEVLVQAPDVDGKFLLMSPAVPKARSLRGNDVSPVPLAYVQVEGAADPTTQVTLPDPNTVKERTKDVIPADLAAADVTVRRTFALRSDDPTFTFQINGVSFDPARVTNVFVKDSCEEWTLKALEAGSGPSDPLSGHPFHVHINPFQVLARDGQPVAQPYWADTLFVPVGHTATVRTRFRHFTGKTVLHCHILDHEDAGMMHAVLIADPGADCPAGDASGARPGALPLPALGLKTGDSDLDLTGNSAATVLVFFQGAGCPSCVRQLKAVVEARRSWGDGKVLLVAVSSETIRDYDRLSRVLGVRADEPVILCADPGLTAFKRMGCEDDGPLHGTFVIKAGKVVWKDVGFTPFRDLDVLSRLLSATREQAGGR